LIRRLGEGGRTNAAPDRGRHSGFSAFTLLEAALAGELGRSAAAGVGRMFLLQCTDAVPSSNEQGPYTSLWADVVRPKAASTAGCHAVEYEAVGWLELHRTYLPSGPLDLTPYPDGGGVALTVFDYGIGGSFHGPAIFALKVHEASFDASPFLGRVYAAEGRDGVKLYDPFAIRPVGWIPEHAYRVSLTQLRLSAALIGYLEAEGILTAADLCVRTTDELLEIRNVGKQQLQEVKARLAEAGLRPWENQENRRTLLWTLLSTGVL
jgi:hypothetical protein